LLRTHLDGARPIAAFAVIRRDERGQTLWLAQWNPKWGVYHFVGGHKRPEETFRECLVREIGEELHLCQRLDYRIASTAPTHLEFMDFSESTQTQTSYIMELFGVELGPGACSKVESDADNRWLSEAEIQAGRTHDGRGVSPTMKRLREAIRERIA